MSVDMITLFAVLGAMTGLGVRPIVFALSVPAGHPPRRGCPLCHAPVLTVNVLAVAAAISGRCRSCRSRITVPPGVIEVPLGVVFALMAYRHTDVWEAFAVCWLAANGAAIALTDIAVHRIPNVLTASGYAGVMLLLAVTAPGHHHPIRLLLAVLAGIGLAGFYGTLALASHGGLGMGDVKLAASLGTTLGWFGLPTLITGTLLGFAMGATYGLLLIATGHLRYRQQFAFGPFMILSAIVAIVM